MYSDNGGPSVGQLGSALLARWRFVAGIAGTAAVVAFGASFLLKNEYTSSTTFIPEARKTSRLPGNLAGLASQFGLDLGEDANESPAFYADLVRSQEVMSRVLTTKFRNFRADTLRDSTALIDLLKVKGNPAARRMEKGIEELNDMVAVSTNAKTGVITLRATANWPGLAKDITEEFLHTINEFNLRRRNSQAGVRRKFVEQRTEEASDDLRRAEDAMRAFQIENRSTANSPTLQSAQRRIERQISIAQDVYLAVRRQLEMARIDEVNDTPVITVIDRPSVPGKKSGPKRGLLGLFAGVLGALGATLVVLLPVLTRRAQPHEASGVGAIFQRA